VPTTTAAPPTRQPLAGLDRRLADRADRPELTGWRRFLTEFWWFGVKEARACVFAGLFFFAVFVVPRGGVWGLARYDVLLVIALALQAWLIWSRIETVDEAKAILAFHAAGFALEVFKVTLLPTPSWSYPDPALTKVAGVPLFAGFMYAAVGSYIMQAWRLLHMRIHHHPPFVLTGILAAALYLNLFTHHWFSDLRWVLLAVALGLYARCFVGFTPVDRERRMPFFLALVLVGFFIWVAENIGTFFGIWRYPDQLGAWVTVSLGKWSSWTVLTLMSFALVSNLKHVKERIHLAP